jgi:DNA-binding transcriptional ArsR family regulator
VSAYQAVLDAVADPTRQAVLERLARGPASVAELAADLPVSRPAVSQHLRVLRDAELVDFDQHGTRNVYRIERSGLEPLRRWLDHLWDDALGAFGSHARARHEQSTDADARGGSR